MTRVPGVGAVAPLLAVALAIILPLWLVTIRHDLPGSPGR